MLPVMGKFKDKDRYCWRCKNQWQDHEEKETDVNIALYLYRGAVGDEYDLALLVSGDSDLVPAIRFVKTKFTEKGIRVLTPVGRNNSGELVHAAGGPAMGRKIKEVHIENSLLPASLSNELGEIVATRPSEYVPPS